MLRTSFLLVATAFTMPALADTHITYVDDSGQPVTQMYVKGSKVRVETNRNGSTVSIYDAAANSMMVLMPDQKKYMLFDQQTAKQMGATVDAAQQQMQAAGAQAQAAMSANQAQIDQANQQMQAAMAQLTPEQRAQAQQLMGQGTQAKSALTPPPGGLQVEMKDLGTSETVAGHSCKDVQMVINGRPGSTLCIADSPGSLGIPGSDLRTLEHMRDGMQKLMANMGPMAQGMAGAMSKGFALKTTHQSMQGYKRVDVTDTFKSVSTAGLSGSLFELPAGYTQTTMAELMQQGHP